MAGLVPAIHVLPRLKTWMRGTSPRMTGREWLTYSQSAPILLRLCLNQIDALWGDRIRLERGFVKISLTIVAHHPASSSAPVSSMLYSVTEAAKQTGLGELTILTAIEEGRISSTKDLFGEWHVDDEELRTLELATQEPALHPHIEDGAQKVQIAVTETEPAPSSQELVPALAGTSGSSSLTSAKHETSEASLELQESLEDIYTAGQVRGRLSFRVDMG